MKKILARKFKKNRIKMIKKDYTSLIFLSMSCCYTLDFIDSIRCPAPLGGNIGGIVNP